MNRRSVLETWRIILMLGCIGILVFGVSRFLEHADNNNRGILLYAAAGWTLIVLSIATFFWQLIDTKLEALHEPNASILSRGDVNASSVISELTEIYKTAPFNRVMMITGLVLMLAAGAKGSWIDLPSVAVSIGNTGSDDEATPLPIVVPTDEPAQEPTPTQPTDNPTPTPATQPTATSSEDATP